MRPSQMVLVLILACGLTSCGERPDSSDLALSSIGSDSKHRVDRGRGEKNSTGEPSDPDFMDVAARSGLTTMIYCGGPDKDHLLESTGCGCAFLDYDGDGRLDIYLVNAWSLDEQPSRVRLKGRNALYRNLGGGTFEDVTEKAHVADESWGCGVCVADYDNDGRVDIFVTNFGPDRLYRNRGDGTFEQVAEKAGVADPGWGGGASFFDADGDGDVDLYVANYVDTTMDEVLAARRTIVWRDRVKVMAGPFGLKGGRDHFYRNNGDGTFRDATDEVGMTDTAESYGLGVLASDLDGDGDIDVFVSNDSNPNFLYRNNGDGTFSEIGAWSGAGLNGNGAAQAGMGVDAGDVDGDGRPDIFLTTFAQDSATLFHNEGGLAFTDISAAQGLKAITREPLKWGCAFFDMDHDADLDVVIVNGHIYPQVDSAPELHETYRQRPILLRNENGRLKDVSQRSGPGMKLAVSARGLAVGDPDDDGDLDLLVTGMDSPPLLLRNETPGKGHWVKLRIANSHGGPAVNARVTLKAAGRTQTREVRSGTSFASQNSLDVHFGLGDATVVESIEVHWPAGGTTRLTNQAIDQTLLIRQSVETPEARAASKGPRNSRKPTRKSGPGSGNSIKPDPRD